MRTNHDLVGILDYRAPIYQSLKNVNPTLLARESEQARINHNIVIFSIRYDEEAYS